MMISFEEAARNLAKAEQGRQAMERVMRVKDDEASAAREACWNAMQRVEEALAVLVQASMVPVPERVVKRPATQASDLLDLDDNGGH